MLLSLNFALFVVLKSDSEMTRSFFHICEASAKDTRAMSSCLLELLVQCCTRANFAQKLLLMNLFIYAIVLIAILHKPYILLTSNISCISINYLKLSIILIVCLLSTGYIKIHLLLNLDFFTSLIITANGEG